MGDRSDIYVRFEQSFGQADWRNLEEARLYQRFRKELFNMCRQLQSKTLEDFFAGDTEYLIETGAIDLGDEEDEDFRHEWFSPDEALPIVRELRFRLARNEKRPFVSRLLELFDSLIEALEDAKAAKTRFHLCFR